MTVYDVRVPDDGSLVDISGLALEEKRVTVLFGPNGAGKTTILRFLAGIGGAEPKLGCHYMPQQPFLFRGSAGWNLGLGLGPEESSWASQLAGRLGLAAVLGRPAQLLSAGERQRLALARALAHREDWLLLDEPLESIDRAERQSVLELMASSLEGRNVVVVTHDLDVAVALADDIAVVDHGRLLQRGPLVEVLRAPASSEVARILGVRNLISGVAIPDEGLTLVKTEALAVVGVGSVEGNARAMFAGESVTLSPVDQPPGSARNRWTGKVVEVRELAGLIEVVVDVGLPLVAVVTRGAVADLHITPGDDLAVSVKASSVTVVPA